MSSSETSPSFIQNETDLIIFVSCISGVLGLVLIFAIIGFLWELCSFVRKKKRLNKRKKDYLNNQTLANSHAKDYEEEHHHDLHCENHYPTWIYNTMVHEQAEIMENYLKTEPTGEKAVGEAISKNQDPEHYINEIFSDIFVDNPTNQKAEKGISYERSNKIVTPEKKPLPVPYMQNQKKNTENETHQNHQKIFVANGNTERHEPLKNGGFAIPLDDLDLDMFETTDDINNPNDAKKIIISDDLTVGEKIKARQNNQTVEYENPKVLEKGRRDRLTEDQRLEQTQAKRIVLERSTSGLKSSKAELSRSVKRIELPIDRNILPSMDENQAHDSFLY